MHKYHPIDARRIKRIQRAAGEYPRRGTHGVYACSPASRYTMRPVVVLNETGRDCDGYDIDTLAFVLPEHVEDYIDDAMKWADGPMAHTPMTARELACWYSSRASRERNLRKGWDDDRF